MSKHKKLSDISNAKLFVSKYLSDHRRHNLSDLELLTKVFETFNKFEIYEVIHFLPKEVVLTLRHLSLPIEENENPLMALGCFGPEVDCRAYLNKDIFGEVKTKLNAFFKKNGKREYGY